MHIATSKYSSEGLMTSACSSLLYFSYFNELDLKMYIITLININVLKQKNVTNAVIFLFQVNGLKI
jgi:hypothetical protein